MYYEHEQRVTPVDETREASWPVPCLDQSSRMVTYLESRQLNPILAKQYNWYPSSCAGDTALRLVIPCTRTDGKIYWQARLMQPELRSFIKRYQSPKVARKDAVVLVGQCQAQIAHLVVVEGPMDALAAASIPQTIGLAIMGNNPPQSVVDHIRLVIKTYNPTKIHLVSDSNSLREFSRIKLALGGIPVLRSPEPYNDLAEMPESQRSSWLHDGRYE